MESLSPTQSGVRRVLSDYGMGVVLLILCGYYSYATWGVQHPAGRAGAEDVVRQAAGVKAPAGGKVAVLIVAEDGEDAGRFAEAAQALARERGMEVAGVARGGPPELAAEARRISQGGGAVQVVLATRAAAAWRLTGRLSSTSPAFASAEVLSPRPYHWPDFLTPANLAQLVDRNIVYAVIAVGMTMVILTGGIDLSVGSLIALGAVMAARLIRDHGGGEAGGAGAIVACCAVAVGVCAVFGLASGVLVTFFNIPPFIVTLAGMLIASGLAFKLSDGQSIAQVPADIAWLGRGRWLGVTHAVWLAAGLYVVGHVVMNRTLLGRYIYAVGGNRKAALLSGVPVRPVVIACYVASAALAGLGGVIETSRLKSGAPTYGTMAELWVIAAVVVGGASLTGGRGKMIGTVIGALIIAVMENGMNLTRVNEYDRRIVLGFVIVAAVLLDTLRNPGRMRAFVSV